MSNLEKLEVLKEVNKPLYEKLRLAVLTTNKYQFLEDVNESGIVEVGKLCSTPQEFRAAMALVYTTQFLRENYGIDFQEHQFRLDTLPFEAAIKAYTITTYFNVGDEE
jgi:hypothetical protein